MKREFIKISERPGVSSQLGEALVKQQEKLFELWHRGGKKRCGCASRFIAVAERHLGAVSRLGKPPTRFGSKSKHCCKREPITRLAPKKRHLSAKTVRTCRQLLKVEPAMWLFVTTEGVEPTNNAAERAIRPAVLWRRTSFGSQSQAGSTFVARMLTVVTTLRSQNRNVLEYMTTAILATRDGKPAPSLLPEVINSEDQVLPAA